jgi:hypothetical protein
MTHWRVFGDVDEGEWVTRPSLEDSSKNATVVMGDDIFLYRLPRSRSPYGDAGKGYSALITEHEEIY